MRISSTSHKGRGIALRIGVAVFWIAVWQLACVIAGLEVLLPSPFATARRFIQLIVTFPFWQTMAASCMRILTGYLLAVAVGLGLAVLTFRFRLVHELVAPLLGTIRATPVASFIILALVWMSRQRLPAFCAFLMVIPIIWANSHMGFKQAPSDLLEMANLFKFSKRKKIMHIYIPAAVPGFAAACTTGLGIAWKAGVAAEVIATPAFSVGKQIYNAKIYLETVDLFAWTAGVVLLSVLLEYLAGLLLRRVQKAFRPLNRQEGRETVGTAD